MILAFFGFLRIGELTCNSTFDPKHHLMKSDITLMTRSSPRYILVRLKVSKTDPFRQGQTLVIGTTNLPLCPISAVVAYLNSRPLSLDSEPLFIYKSGAFLTREKLTRETRLLISKGGLHSSEFAGHSFRIGAPTTAASVNQPPWLIKALGRWSSDCFERYIKTPPSVLAQVPKKLVNLLQVREPVIYSAISICLLFCEVCSSAVTRGFYFILFFSQPRTYCNNSSSLSLSIQSHLVHVSKLSYNC